MSKFNSILILDGAMGTMLQRRGLCGNSDMFNLTAPDDVAAIHQAYIEAGADIISTNTFNSNRISQQEQGCADMAAQMAYAGASIARETADKAMASNPGRRILVAGSVGPSSKSLSIAGDLNNPMHRSFSFDQMAEAYKEQTESLIRGGVDFILIETCMDALNAKAAIYGIPEGFPVMISVTSADKSGRLLTGQTIEAFYHSLKHCNPVAFSINCSFGALEMAPLVEKLKQVVDENSANCLIGCYPNAGLPNELGEYDQTPEMMASAISPFAEMLDIVGGCCGTTPEHIAAIRDMASRFITKEGTDILTDKLTAHKNFASNGVAPLRPTLTVSGLECITIDSEKGNFTLIGERTNVAGSRKFAKLIAAKAYAEALEVAANQIENGASVIDVNMDDAMLESEVEMQNFVRCIAGEPAVAKAALMIDSSHWETILAGLENAGGKSIVNSISLKEGEDEFLRKALIINKLGAAMVVMAFDEEGQATTYRRKIEICSRAYKLLTGAGIPANDIIFDCNVLTIATGVESDRRYAIDFIESVRWIKQNLPGALTSGGVSNLSFAFRGNNTVREAMHSVFLYHAIAAGLDMGIVNAGMLQIYDNIEPTLRKACEDVILDSDPDATERLIVVASAVNGVDKESITSEKIEKYTLPQLIVKGSSDQLEPLLQEAYAKYGSANGVIEGPLMEGMRLVGEYFASGKMFLPQVVKSAKIMKEAVEYLQPILEKETDDGHSDNRPVFVIATVKGDVHDIGKNITASILACNGFKVIDLGVMVEKERIIDSAIKENAAIIGVSGLITPSLLQMEDLCRAMNDRGLTIPLFVGGATTSKKHTLLKLKPLYKHAYYGCDASATALMAKRYISDGNAFEQEEQQMEEETAKPIDNSAIYGNSSLFNIFPQEGYPADELVGNQSIGAKELPLSELIPLFDWKMFLMLWRIKPSQMNNPQVRQVIDEAKKRLNTIQCKIVVALELRGAKGYFAASVHSLHPANCDCPACADMMEKMLRLTLAEAASEWIGRQIRVPEGYQMIRPGIGYPIVPDHSLKLEVLKAIPNSDKLGISLTESYAMLPESSVCGYILIHKEASYSYRQRRSQNDK